MTWWEAALLGLLQGLTEFLPVSSSGHLVLGQYLLGLDAALAEEVTFEVFMHFGTALSILTVYRRRVVELTAAVFRNLARPAALGQAVRDDGDLRLALLIALSMLPAILVYLFFKDALEAAFSDPRLVCAMLIVTGILLLLTLLRRHPDGNVSWGKALLIGIAQSVALIPGISRSGSTICTAIYLNVDREEAADFSFLMVLPVILAATVLKALELFEVESSVGIAPLLIGTIVAYVSGIWAIKVVINFVKRGRLQYFAYYCFLIGGLGLLLI